MMYIYEKAEGEGVSSLDDVDAAEAILGSKIEFQSKNSSFFFL